MQQSMILLIKLNSFSLWFLSHLLDIYCRSELDFYSKSNQNRASISDFITNNLTVSHYGFYTLYWTFTADQWQTFFFFLSSNAKQRQFVFTADQWQTFPIAKQRQTIFNADQWQTPFNAKQRQTVFPADQWQTFPLPNKGKLCSLPTSGRLFHCPTKANYLQC